MARVRVKADARYWYFITQKDMGEEMSLSPRHPIHTDDDEPLLRRICVAPTAAHCMTAISLYTHSDLYVYRTRRKVKATKAWNVYDSHITKEHWLLGKTRFVKVDTIDFKKQGDTYCNWFTVGSEEDQYRSKTAIISWCRRRDPRLSTIKHANELWRKVK